MKNFFIITWNSCTKDIELWNGYGSAKGHGQPFAKLPLLYISFLLGTVHRFFCNASFFLVQRQTGRHPVALALDKVETRVGADRLIHPYLIEDSNYLFFSHSPAMGQPPPVSSASQTKSPSWGMSSGSLLLGNQRGLWVRIIICWIPTTIPQPSVQIIMVSNLNPDKIWFHLSKLFLERRCVNSLPELLFYL